MSNAKETKQLDQPERVAYDDWIAEAVRRFGKDHMKWKFVCPTCEYPQTIQDYKDAGAPSEAAAFSCVGRWDGHMDNDAFASKGKGPCNYAGGGLIGLNPITVVYEDGKEKQAFAFADADPEITLTKETPPCQTLSSPSPKGSGPDGSKKETQSESPRPEKNGDSPPGEESRT